jgi:hypothetical protein
LPSDDLRRTPAFRWPFQPGTHRNPIGHDRESPAGARDRDHPQPAGLAPLIAKKTINKSTSRMGNPGLAEKRTYPHFYIA